MKQTVNPQLRMTDPNATLAFYTDGLGFSVDWEHRFEPNLPMFVQLTRNDQTVFLSVHAGDCQVGGSVYFIVPDVDACFTAFTGRGVPGVEPPVDTPWRSREMVVTDHDGNRLRFAAHKDL